MCSPRSIVSVFWSLLGQFLTEIKKRSKSLKMHNFIQRKYLLSGIHSNHKAILMNKTTPKFSIVIPFFDEFPYIWEAVHSCQTMTTNDVEIIVVNDNPDLVKESDFAKFQFPENVRVVSHPHNKGLQAARNTGIKEAQGDYIAFLDADDYFLTSKLEKCMQFVLETKSDITHFQTFIRPLKGKHLKLNPQDRKHYSDEVSLSGDSAKIYGMHSMSTWSSIYRRDFLIEKNLFGDEEQRKFEDRLFVVKTMLQANSVSNFPQGIRIWRRRANSITTSQIDLTAINLKSKMVLKVLKEIINSGQNHEVVNAYLINEVGQFYSHTLSGGVQLFREFYSNENIGETSEARHRVSQALRLVDKYNLDTEIHKSINSRLKALKRKSAPQISFATYLKLKELFLAEDHAKISKAIVEYKATKTQQLAKDSIIQKNEPGVDYILHLGAHKTGSTSIQKFFDANRQRLASKGILFPESGFGGLEEFESVKSNGVPGHDALRSALVNGNQELLADLSKEIEKWQCKSVLISAENFCSSLYGGGNEEAFSKFYNALSFLPNIRSIQFVISVREPVSWLDSFYREQLAGGLQGVMKYNGPDEYALANMDKMDFDSLISRLEVLSDQPVTLIDFEEAKKEGVIPSFLSNVFPETAKEILEEIPLVEEFRYPAISDADVAVLNMLKNTVRDVDVYKDMAREFLSSVPESNSREILFRDVIQKKVLAAFKSKNPKLLAQLPTLASRSKLTVEKHSPDLAVPVQHLEVMANILSRPYAHDGHVNTDDSVSVFFAQQSFMKKQKNRMIKLAKLMSSTKRLKRRR